MRIINFFLLLIFVLYCLDKIPNARLIKSILFVFIIVTLIVSCTGPEKKPDITFPLKEYVMAEDEPFSYKIVDTIAKPSEEWLVKAALKTGSVISHVSNIPYQPVSLISFYHAVITDTKIPEFNWDISSDTIYPFASFEPDTIH